MLFIYQLLSILIQHYPQTLIITKNFADQLLFCKTIIYNFVYLMVKYAFKFNFCTFLSPCTFSVTRKKTLLHY